MKTTPKAETYARDESVRRIFSVLGIPPEELAYTMAAYSRSRRSFLETNTYINSQRAAQFLETFYFAYGHGSIADMAHIPMAIENVSILAAIDIVSEQLWDGQERSTRYQDFLQTGYCLPDEIKDTDDEKDFVAAADGLLEAYTAVNATALEHFLDTVEKPDELDEKGFERTLKARAFDVARYLLPLGTYTSVGQIVSARTLERQISRLLASPFGEVRRIAEAMRTANQDEAENPRDKALLEAAEQLRDALADTVLDPEAQKALGTLVEGLKPTPAAPTLVKYTAPLTYRPETEAVFREVYEGLLGHAPIEEADPVTLVEVDDPTVEAISKLLYTVGRHPYRQIVQHTVTLSPHERKELLDMAFGSRGPHDPWLEEMRVPALNFDILMDTGSFRDLHRHRRCQQYRQPYTTALGFDTPDLIDATGCQAVYGDAVQQALACADRINEKHPHLGAYIMPMAVRSRTLFSMDLAEMAYIAELRTRPTGHFSYRNIAYEMYRVTVDRYPDFAPHVRAVHPDYEDLLER